MTLTSCFYEDKSKSGKLVIVATTGMIGDAVKNICGDSVELITLMGSGVDPHLFKPTPRDIDKLAEADIIVYNGLHLEGKMGEILEKVSRQKKVINLSDGIPKEYLIITNPDQVQEGGKISYDPHIWFDIALWSKGIAHLGKEVAAFDTLNKGLYEENLFKYKEKLHNLHNYTKVKIAEIPERQRLIITAHDAFNYFGQAYNIEVMGLQGISTVAEPGLKDISNLVDLLVSRKVKAVYVESSVSERAINAVIQGCLKRGHPIKIGGTLFSDAMGQAGTPEGTYEGMVRHNVKVIVEGLK
jgi:manganese/zinc/iron transport system substrate-binding protein